MTYVSFANKETKLVYDNQFCKQFQGGVAKAAQKKFQMIADANTVNDLRTVGAIIWRNCMETERSSTVCESTNSIASVLS